MEQYELGVGVTSDDDEADVDSNARGGEDSDTVSSEDSIERTLK